MLVVNLQVGDPDGVLHLAGRRGDLVVDVAERARDDATLLVGVHATCQRVRLARPGLPVSEDGAIEPLQDRSDHRLGDALKHLLLQRGLTQHPVEPEAPVGALVVDHAGQLVLGHLHLHHRQLLAGAAQTGAFAWQPEVAAAALVRAHAQESGDRGGPTPPAAPGARFSRFTGRGVVLRSGTVRRRIGLVGHRRRMRCRCRLPISATWSQILPCAGEDTFSPKHYGFTI
mmetsp:Transcript_25344/g.81931  ORF Transcript_25344/g.81931 Transcript_25344/m.81931 type:complete len:229 (+) Transcript_25344:825-1511(+)